MHKVYKQTSNITLPSALRAEYGERSQCVKSTNRRVTSHFHLHIGQDMERGLYTLSLQTDE